MTNSDFDVRLARHLRSLGRETCGEADVHEFVLMSIAHAVCIARLLHEDRADRHPLPRSGEVRAGRLQCPVHPGRTSLTNSRENGLTQIKADSSSEAFFSNPKAGTVCL